MMVLNWPSLRTVARVSAPGAGTRVEIWLPRADPPVAVMWWPAHIVTSCDGTRVARPIADEAEAERLLLDRFGIARP